MKQRIRLLLVLLGLYWLPGLVAKAQPADGWHLEKDKDQIQVYSRHVAGSPLTELKVTCILPGTQSQLVASLSDISNYKQVIYKTKAAYLVKRCNETELIYHIVNELPWPVEDRDVTIRLSFAQDSVSRLLHIRAVGIPNVVPLQPGTIRVEEWLAVWQVRQINKRNIQITYTCRVNPGGSIPAWLDNLAAATSAHRSFILIRDSLSLPRYQDKTFPFLQM